MANIARLGVILGLSSAEFVAGIEAAKRKTNELAATFNKVKAGAAVVGTAFAAAAIQTAHFADQLNDTADAYDVTLGYILDISNALEAAGGKFENTGRVLGQFATKVNEAATGSKEAQESFAKIGITLDDLRDLDNEELFAKTVDNIARIKDPITRSAEAVDKLGRGFRGVDIKAFNEELKNGGAATDRQKRALQDLADTVRTVELAFRKAQILFATSLSDAIETAKINFGDFGKVVSVVADVIAKAFEGVVFGIGVVVEAIKLGVKAINNVITATFSSASLADLNAKSGKEFLENLRKLAEVGTKPPATKDKDTGGRTVEKAKDSKLEQLLKELKTIEQISAAYQATLKLQVEGINLQTAKLSMTKNDAELAQVAYDLEKKRAEQVAQLQDKIDVAKSIGADPKVIAALQEQISKVNKLTEEYKVKILDATVANQTFAQSFEGGIAAAFQKFQFDAINTASYVEQSVDSLFSNMESAINKFVETGKFSFEDFTKSIIQDLIKIQLRMQLVALFAAALGAAKGAFTPGTSSFIAGPPAPTPRAEGGPIDANTPYLVGERGPELIVPKRSGTVIPNNALGNNNQPQIVYNGPYIENVSAIDSKSFEDRLLQSHNAIWAANQYANKSLQVSRSRT